MSVITALFCVANVFAFASILQVAFTLYELVRTSIWCDIETCRLCIDSFPSNTIASDILYIEALSHLRLVDGYFIQDYVCNSCRFAINIYVHRIHLVVIFVSIRIYIYFEDGALTDCCWVTIASVRISSVAPGKRRDAYAIWVK